MIENPWKSMKILILASEIFTNQAKSAILFQHAAGTPRPRAYHTVVPSPGFRVDGFAHRPQQSDGESWWSLGGFTNKDIIGILKMGISWNIYIYRIMYVCICVYIYATPQDLHFVYQICPWMPCLPSYLIAYCSAASGKYLGHMRLDTSCTHM